MPPKKSPLQKIRQQVKEHRKGLASVTAGSAFRRIEKSNHKFEHGWAPSDDNEGQEFRRFLPPVSTKVKKTAVKKKTKLSARRRLVNPTEPAEKVIETWRRVGGEGIAADGSGEPTEPTRIVGVARVPTWAIETFGKGIKDLILDLGEAQDLVKQEVKDGAEDFTDVYAVCRSELAAEVIKDGIHGEMVAGRKLQVRYA